ncbi:MAG: thiamine diphosphokinase [Clostridiales bacterium]|nr:thiamine diphosphokinase [Clostridiales bacterium]
MACFIFGAGSFDGLVCRPAPGDYVIAADGGYRWCRQEGIEPDLLLGDFDSLPQVPELNHILRVPVEKDDTDMMLSVKKGLEMGHTLFYLYGGMGGDRTDHTIANLQTLLYLTRRGARGYLYGKDEYYTALCNGRIEFPAQKAGILSVFCLGEAAEGVHIAGGQYPLDNARLTSEFPLGVSNHFVGQPIRVSVKQGMLLLGLHDE